MQLVLLIFPLVTIVGGSLTVEYYEKLIKQRIKETDSFKVPHRNEEFNTGYKSRDVNDFGSFDFIIVGAGSSGSVLATRLSEIDNFTILLLEAGGEEDDFNQITAYNSYLQFGEMNWGYYTTRQSKSCLGMKEQKCNMPRGKSIGGSSAINAMMFIRGHSKDYDKWVELGNPGWSFKEVLPYFRKFENSQIDGDEGYHGKGGFLNVEYSKPRTPLLRNFIQANIEANMTILDYNGRDTIGAAELQFSLKRGKRQSTGTAFLQNARQRKNLKVLTKALVIKVVINPKTKIAEEVVFVQDNKKYKAAARNEIILSGGVFNTPQLLMLSGIGPKSHLKKIGIKVLTDLPVGKNLRDHNMFSALTFRTNYTAQKQTTRHLVEMYLKGEGPLTLGAASEALGFLPPKNGPQDIPITEYFFVPPTGTPMPIMSRAYNYNKNLHENYMNKINPQTDIGILIALLHPKSKGTVSLKSANPIDFPEIDLNMFDRQEDVDNVIEAIKFVIDLFKTKPFKEIDAQLLDYPICQEFKSSEKKFWECVIRQTTTTIYHACCTTPMGPNPKNSVVDTNLKVLGLKNLRIVDAGVFPTTLSGHPNAAAIMIAEKISDVIKKEYGYKKETLWILGI